MEVVVCRISEMLRSPCKFRILQNRSQKFAVMVDIIWVLRNLLKSYDKISGPMEFLEYFSKGFLF